MPNSDTDLFQDLRTTPASIQGQWTGRLEGTNSGQIVLDLDLFRGSFRGAAHAFDDNPALPTMIVFLDEVPHDFGMHRDVPVAAVNGQGNYLNAHDLLSLDPPIIAPKTANIETSLSDGKIAVKWTTDIGTHGSAILSPSRSSQPSEYKAPEGPMGWREYKEYVLGLEPDRFIFRGQPAPYRLRSSFHRTCRSDLIRYIIEDIPMLHRNLSARTRHYFQLSDPAQNGAFYHLIQHHGYPTPLLDWTYSPYVAAFFAFQQANEVRSTADCIRIYVFNKKEWCQRFPQIQQVAHQRPHFSILEAVSLGNERAVPQQALSSVSNVDDVESYIASMETIGGEFITVIDIPKSERGPALAELQMMGITAGSMFPGLDGACQELRARNFAA